MAGLVSEDITYQILSVAFEVHNTLGPGFLENVYQGAMIHELDARGIKAESEHRISVSYRDKVVGAFSADILVEDEVIVELKAVEFLNRAHDAQVLNYLKATGKRVGLLINFGSDRVEHKRFVL